MNSVQHLPPPAYVAFVSMPFHAVRFENVKAILTDIEGTTTSISFVHDVLFPYAKQHVGQFLRDHQNDAAVAGIIEEVKKVAETPGADLDQVTATLLSWMQQDKKITPLKALQGLMWDEGYQRGDFQSHLYEDAYLQLKKWNEQRFPLYVYSSGSVQAQKLLFGHSTYGDLTPYFSGYFDTKVGGKKEIASYVAIAQQIQRNPEEVLFLTDTVDEFKAAKGAGMQAILLVREGSPLDEYPSVSSFDQLDIR